jgi:tripartite-type tricarboxylate transporter receptor subunit TctC
MTIDSRRRGVTLGLLASAGGAGAPAARASGAATFPERPVTIVVPNAPGGSMDTLARVLQQQLQAIWDRTVIVEYKPGANTVLGTEFTARAAPTGHTLCVVATSHVINPVLRRLPFDTSKDLAGITILGVSDILISAHPAFPATTLQEAIAVIQRHPGKYSYASPGSGSAMHLAMELLKQRANLDLLHVPFRGSGPAYPDVLAGRVDLLVEPLFSTLPFLKLGRLKPIALTQARRSRLAPTIPPVADTIAGFDVESMFGLVVASGTPRAVVRKIYADVRTGLDQPETRRQMADLGLEPDAIEPEAFDTRIRTEIERWRQVVTAAGIKLD